jgi:hypothetical protein
MMRIDVRSRTKLGLVGMLVVLLTLLAVTAAFAQDECPGDWKIYIGGPVLDTDAVRGTKDNPAANRDEAWSLCLACSGAAYLYEYDTIQETYRYYNVCSTIFPETSGSPLSQSVIIGLLVLGALVLVAWGLYTRMRLKRV